MFDTFAGVARRYGARVVHPHEIPRRSARWAIAADGHPLDLGAAHLDGDGASRIRPLFADLF